MFADVNLRKLTEMTTPGRTFLSVYLAGPHSTTELKNRFQKVRRVLKGGRAEKDEREHFDENVKSVLNYLERNPLKSGSLCIFSCRTLNFFQAVSLMAPVKDLVWIDSSPFIRPLAELQDEYETDPSVFYVDGKIGGKASNIAPESETTGYHIQHLSTMEESAKKNIFR